MTGTVTDHLISFSRKRVPNEALAMMALSMFDWAACGIAGRRDGAFEEFVSGHLRQGGGQAGVFGGGLAPAATAALLNGTLSHALDYDDTHFGHIGHPSVAVLPAVVALAQELRADFDMMIEAAAIGVEASVMTGMWLGRDHYQVGYHQTATAGAFGATLGICRLLELDTQATRAALGLCASMASGIKAQFGTMAKPLNAGLAARTGVEAALWAQGGMTAALDGLAGPLGFGPTHHGMAVEIKPPGKHWRIMQISHKFHACCHGLHAMLEAVSAARLDAEDIQSITIRTHPRWMSVCNIAEPHTGLAAKFSYVQTCAMAILGFDTGATEHFTDAIACDPSVVALRQRITVKEDARLSETQTEVSVTFGNGAMRRLRHDLLAPITIETRAAKLQDKACALIGESRAQAVWQAVEAAHLEDFGHQLVMS